MCDCIEKTNAEFAKRGLNTVIQQAMIGPKTPFIETAKADPKKRGSPCKLFASYCPMCGTEYSAEMKQGVRLTNVG